MILRRVIEHVKAQNWTAVWLDFIIVVVGILIAFQITEWNGVRKDKALQREYLERIYVDLEATLVSRGAASTWDVERKAQQILVLNALRSGVLEDRDRAAFDTGLAYFGFVSGIEVQWATVEELQSTGAMNLIRDTSLRSQILELDADIRRRQGIASSFMDAIYAHREKVSDRYQIIEFNGERNDVRLEYDFDRLAADDSFLNILSQIDLLARFRNDLNKPTLEQLAALQDEIGRRLGKSVGDQP